jgi:hypothetical protein
MERRHLFLFPARALASVLAPVAVAVPCEERQRERPEKSMERRTVTLKRLLFQWARFVESLADYPN